MMRSLKTEVNDCALSGLLYMILCRMALKVALYLCSYKWRVENASRVLWTSVVFFFLSLFFASVSSGNSGPVGNFEAGKPSSLRDTEENRVWYARGMC